ncbi:MAG: hypothetical protein GX597_18645 [Anaerolineaceae bacterium]|nr:hypothetical protein [Anaerolineaceae bacterium]
MEPTVAARPERLGGAAEMRDCPAIRFPPPGQKRRAWPALLGLLPRGWRRTVVIHGRRYWQPG